MVFRWRTFYMYATTEKECNDWVSLINWRLVRITSVCLSVCLVMLVTDTIYLQMFTIHPNNYRQNTWVHVANKLRIIDGKYKISMLFLVNMAKLICLINNSHIKNSTNESFVCCCINMLFNLIGQYITALDQMVYRDRTLPATLTCTTNWLTY